MFGLSSIDLIVIFAYFCAILAIGIWSSRRIVDSKDFFLGGRRFGKAVQTFAAFGQGTSADTAVATTATTFGNGIAGIWSAMLHLFATPLYWVCTHWPRRMRILTMGDFYEERYNSRAMAAVYALIGSLCMMAFVGLGLSAMSKTVVAIVPKMVSEYSATDRENYRQAFVAAGVEAEHRGEMRSVLNLSELEERETLHQLGQDELTNEQRDRLDILERRQPAMQISHLSVNTLVWAVCLIVLLYAVLGGLEAAFLTDMLQGVFIILLSLLLLPFAWHKVGRLNGGGITDAFSVIHERLPDAFFRIFGAPQTPDFTWYYILTLSTMAALTVVVQPNQAILAGSAKDELSSRVGMVVGNFLKRFCVVMWGVFGLAAIVLYQGKVAHGDMLWGHATRDLLGPLNLGLVGLMIACLLAALMSSVDCQMLTSSSLLTHNLYAPFFPGRTAKHYVWVGRIFGVLVVIGGAVFALQFDSILQFLKFIWEVNVMLVPVYWLGAKWRRANKTAAWASIVVGGLAFLVLPALLPALAPSMRVNERLLVTNAPAPVIETAVAKRYDVLAREVAIAEWTSDLKGKQTVAARPMPLALGETFTQTYEFPKRSLFWSKGLQVDEAGNLYGGGLFLVELWVADQLGLNLERNPHALNETCRILIRTLSPILLFILVALMTKPDPEHVLNRFFAKMRTKVRVDPVEDQAAVEMSLRDPHHLDHLLVLPGSQFEIYRWTRPEWRGLFYSLLGVVGVISLLYVLVSLGG